MARWREHAKFLKDKAACCVEEVHVGTAGCSLVAGILACQLAGLLARYSA